MRQRLAFGVLAANGAVIGHAAGYAAVSGDTVGHGYLPAVAIVLVPLGVIAAAVLAKGRAPGRGLELARRLLTAQVAVYLAWEVGERLLARLDPLAFTTEAAVVAGLAAQMVGVALLVLAVGVVREASVPSLAVPARGSAPPDRAGFTFRHVVVPASAPRSPRSLRGPPVTRFA